MLFNNFDKNYTKFQNDAKLTTTFSRTYCNSLSFFLSFFNKYRMQRAHPEEYNFIPQTWVLPAEYPLCFIVQTYIQ